jgi:hypothetical protein
VPGSRTGNRPGWNATFEPLASPLGVRSFEAVFGSKKDRWLEYTVAGVLLVNEVEQVLSSRRGEVETDRRLEIGTAATSWSMRSTSLRKNPVDLRHRRRTRGRVDRTVGPARAHLSTVQRLAIT